MYVNSWIRQWNTLTIAAFSGLLSLSLWLGPINTINYIYSCSWMIVKGDDIAGIHDTDVVK